MMVMPVVKEIDPRTLHAQQREMVVASLQSRPEPKPQPQVTR